MRRRNRVCSDDEVISVSIDDPECFSLLVQTHAHAILVYLTRRVGPDDAEDLAADTFLTAFSRRRNYVSIHGSALPWLYGIATNLLRNYSRSERRRIEFLSRMAAAEGSGIRDNTNERRVEAAHDLQRLAMGLANLADSARDVVMLVGIEGLSYEEASVALGVPVGTVRSRLSRARDQLRGSVGCANCTEATRTERGVI